MALLELSTTAAKTGIVAAWFRCLAAIGCLAGVMVAIAILVIVVMIVTAVRAVHVRGLPFLRCEHAFLVLLGLALANHAIVLELGESNTDLGVALHQRRT